MMPCLRVNLTTTEAEDPPRVPREPLLCSSGNKKKPIVLPYGHSTGVVGCKLLGLGLDVPDLSSKWSLGTLFWLSL